MTSGTRLRRATVGCCAVLMAAGSFTAPASASPPPAAISLPPGLAEAVRRDLGIDVREYLERTGTAQRLAEFAGMARLEHPASFAGVRMEGARAIVSLADGQGVEAARQSAERAGFTVESVAASEATLRARRATFERWLAGQARSVTDAIVGYGIDVVHNAVAVSMTKQVDVPEEAGPVRPESTVMPEARPDNSTATAQAIADAEPTGDIIGGEPFAIEVGGKAHKCSFGFNGTDADGHTVAITAGHCDPNNLVEPAAKTKEPQHIFESAGLKPGQELGQFEYSNLGPHDYSIIRINDSVAPRFQNNLVSTRQLASSAVGSSKLPAGSSGVPAGSSDAAAGGSDAQSSTDAAATDKDVLRIDGTAEPVVGGAVCKSGFRSGYSCGTVVVAGQEGLLRGIPGHDSEVVKVEDMFFTSVCAQRGDSGGPIFAGTKAIGINSAIITAASPLDNGCGHLPILLGQPITTVLKDHPGLTIRTK